MVERLIDVEVYLMLAITLGLAFRGPVRLVRAIIAVWLCLGVVMFVAVTVR